MLLDDLVIEAIFFQTDEMKTAFAAYPDVLLVDATYKLNDIHMPLYVLMVIDGNGKTSIWMRSIFVTS